MAHPPSPAHTLPLSGEELIPYHYAREAGLITRVTVPVTNQTLEAFQLLAEFSGVSVGRAMGEWLAEQLQAVEYMALRMQEARSAPREAAQMLHLYAAGSADAARELVERVGRRAADVSPASGSGGRPEASPRPVIRGGKSPGKTRKEGRE
jgi:hypothetical protein